MDKTIQLILVITVAIVAALIMISLVTGQKSGFVSFLEGNQKDSQCTIWKKQYFTEACSDGLATEKTVSVLSVDSEELKSCSWTSGNGEYANGNC